MKHDRGGSGQALLPPHLPHSGQAKRAPVSSTGQAPESRDFDHFWIPAFAGTTILEIFARGSGDT